jgi:hypothetical protein
MTFADVDGTGKLSLAVGAPEDGGGIVSLFPLDSLSAGDTAVSAANRSLRTSPPASQLGSSLGWLKQPLGEALVLGAPSLLPKDAPGSGAAFIVGAPTLGVLPIMKLQSDGQPAASTIAGDRTGAAFGSHLIIDDFTQDGIDDLVIAAAAEKTVYLFQGPLL